MGETMRQGLTRRGLKLAGAGIGFLALAFAAIDAQATEGYLQYGYGARQDALGGAGVADSRDAMALALNPAGLVDVGRQFQIGASLFMPFRSYTATGTELVAPGNFDSSQNIFVVPNIAYNNPIDANSSWGIALFGNGGMNTNWPVMENTALGCERGGPPGLGTFCAGQTGVDMMQAFVALGYARRFGAFSFGISPTIAIQRFKAQGLAGFSLFSSDPTKLTNNGYDYSYGGGLRAGVEWSLSPNFRIGFSGQTPMWMTKFDKYSGLFADHGNFDIPANLTAGVAWDVMPALTLMADYKHIFYSGIQSIADTQAVPLPFGSLGLPDATGFGWHDIDVVKFGAEWRASPAWTWRIGYAHNTSPIKSTDVTFNILAPGVTTDHITGGFAYKANANSTFEFAAAYVPSHSVSGIELTPFGPNPASNIQLSMHQYQFTLGYTYDFAPLPAPSKMVYK